MKCVPLPSRLELQAAQENLQWSRVAPGAEDLVLWAHWGRSDARLAELLVAWIADHFEDVNSVALAGINHQSPCPQAILVLAEFARLRLSAGESAARARMLAAWMAPLAMELPPADFQMFFLRAGTPRPKRDRELIARSLKPYLRWGFGGADSLTGLKGQLASNGTMLDKNRRMAILRDLLKRKKRLTVNDYIEACGNRVHRRAAERDLRSARNLRASGKTRGRFYVRVS